MPKVLMALYQADILDEEILIYWGTHTSKKYVDKDVSKKVKGAAAPFIKVRRPAQVKLSSLFGLTLRYFCLVCSGLKRLKMTRMTSKSLDVRVRPAYVRGSTLLFFFSVYLSLSKVE
jgi:hypothetical protein